MYSFVFLGYNNDYDVLLQKKMVEKLENVYCLPAPQCYFEGFMLFVFRTFKSIDKRYIKMSKKLWRRWYTHQISFRKLMDREIKDKNHIVCLCVLSQEYYRLKQRGILNFFLQNFRYVKIVVEFADRVQLDIDKNETFDLEELRQEVNLLVTYNKVDAERYNIELSPRILYDYSFVKQDGSAVNDVFYIGRDKGRHSQIVDIYRRCVALGLKCDFHIVDVGTNVKKEKGILYHGSISYEKMLGMESKAKCILNLMQEGSEGITLRDFEAIGMQKLIMTNGLSVHTIGDNESNIIATDDIENQYVKIFNNYPCKWDVEQGTYKKYFFWLEKVLVK